MRFDDTGSMGNEILGIKQFDDPVHFGNQYSDSSSFITALNAIIASRGGDCPEWGMSGIEAALAFIPASSDTDTVEAFFFTDAGQKSNDPFTFTDIETLLTAKNATLHSIVSVSGCNYLDANWFN